MTGFPNLIRANASQSPAAPEKMRSQPSSAATEILENRLMIEQKLLRVDQSPNHVLVGQPLSVERIAFLVAGLVRAFFKVRPGDLEFFGLRVASISPAVKLANLVLIA